MFNEKEYEFLIGKEIKNENSTIEENGILDDKNYFINVVKKQKKNINKNINDNNDIIQRKDNSGKINEEISKNKSDIQILGTPIIIVFYVSSGAKLTINIGEKKIL